MRGFALIYGQRLSIKYLRTFGLHISHSFMISHRGMKGRSYVTQDVSSQDLENSSRFLKAIWDLAKSFHKVLYVILERLPGHWINAQKILVNEAHENTVVFILLGVTLPLVALVIQIEKIPFTWRVCMCFQRVVPSRNKGLIQFTTNATVARI